MGPKIKSYKVRNMHIRPCLLVIIIYLSVIGKCMDKSSVFKQKSATVKTKVFVNVMKSTDFNEKKNILGSKCYPFGNILKFELWRRH